jgi:hypothetical protein
MKYAGNRRRRRLNAIAMMGGIILTMNFDWRVSATPNRQRVVTVAKASIQELLDRPVLFSFHPILRASRDIQINLAAPRLLSTPPILISASRISIHLLHMRQGPQFIAALPAVDRITTLPGRSMI